MSWEHEWIKTYLTRLGRYLEKECFHKYSCDEHMIANAIRAKGVACYIEPNPKPFLDPLVKIQVRDYVVVVDEEIHAIYIPTNEKIYGESI